VSRAPGSRTQNITLLLLTLVSFANYVDRMVLNALSQPIKHEFNLSDTQLGLLTGFAFVLLYAFAAVPIATLADRGSKSLVLAVSLAFWSIATAACGLTKSYAQLLIARLGVGIGESSCQPIGYALIAEYFPSERRATATDIARRFDRHRRSLLSRCSAAAERCRSGLTSDTCLIRRFAASKNR
jgi:MFS family permease